MGMRPDDFFQEHLTADAWPETVLDRDLIDSVAKGTARATDVDQSAAILELLRSELEAFANGGSNRIKDDADIELVIRAARMACKRAGVEFPNLPFRNFASWMSHWRKEGLSGGGSWQARRDYLSGLFKPSYERIEKLQLRALDDGLAEAVSPWGRTGWTAVDAEIADYSAVGTACVRVLEFLGDAVFDPAVHLAGGEADIPRDRTKDRLTRVIGHALGGADGEELRKVAVAAVALAHRVKHRATPGRRDAGMAADSVILLSNLVRRAVGAI